MIARRRVSVDAQDYESFLGSFAGPSVDGELVKVFEGELAKFVGVKHAITVSSGRQAMSQILQGINISAGDEVIIPAYTLGALLYLVESRGAKVVLADIDEKTLTVTAKTIVERITEKTKAIIVLHIFGNPCNMKEIIDLAQKKGIALVEDCAHSLGATIDGRQTGSLGKAGFLSFETTKPVNTFGGGAVVTNDDGLALAIREQAKKCEDMGHMAVYKKAKGLEREKWLFSSGLSYLPLFLLSWRPTRSFVEFAYRFVQPPPPESIPYLPQQAKLGLSGLASLKERIAHREKMARLYHELLHEEIKPQVVRSNCISTWYFYVALLPKAAFPIRRKLLFQKVDCAVEKEIADDCTLLREGFSCPVTNHVYERAIVLPMYDDIKEEDVVTVAKAVNEAL